MFNEPATESWRRRYGGESPDAAEAIAPFLTHRCVRRYDDRPIGEDVIRALIAAAQSAATSSNLQLWSVVSVQDPERRATIAHLCGDQKQVLNAPWFLAVLADHHRLRQAAEREGEPTDNLDYMEFTSMAMIDAALAAERLVCAAESIGIGVCYIGGLRDHPHRVAELLDLPDGVFGVFGLCLGYPDPEHPADIKPRLSQDSIWFRENYDRAATTSEYDERMESFYAEQKMGGAATWSKRSGKRLSQMTGRENQLPWLQRIGMARR